MLLLRITYLKVFVNTLLALNAKFFQLFCIFLVLSENRKNTFYL